MVAQTITFTAPATVWEDGGVAYTDGNKPNGATLRVRGGQKIEGLTLQNMWFYAGDGGITPPSNEHTGEAQEADFLLDQSTSKLYVNVGPSLGTAAWIFIADKSA